jgi:hypothetical protein
VFNIGRDVAGAHFCVDGISQAQRRLMIFRIGDDAFDGAPARTW